MAPQGSRGTARGSEAHSGVWWGQGLLGLLCSGVDGPFCVH